MAEYGRSQSEPTIEISDEAPAMLATMPGVMTWSPATTIDGGARSIAGTPEGVFMNPQQVNAIEEYNRHHAEQAMALRQMNDIADKMKNRKNSMSTSVSSTKRGSRSACTSDAGVRRPPALRDTAPAMNQELGKVMETESIPIEIAANDEVAVVRSSNTVTPDPGSRTSSSRGRSGRPPSASPREQSCDASKASTWGNLPARAPLSYGPCQSASRAKSTSNRAQPIGVTRASTSSPTVRALASIPTESRQTTDHVMAIEDAGAMDGIIQEYRAEAQGLQQQILAINCNIIALPEGNDKQKAEAEARSLREQLTALIEKSRIDEERIKGTEAVAQQQRVELERAENTIYQGMDYVGGMHEVLTHGDAMWRAERARVSELESEMQHAAAAHSALQHERAELMQGMEKIRAEAGAEIAGRDAKIQEECRVAQRSELKASAERHERQLSEERERRKDVDIVTMKKTMQDERAAWTGEGQRIMRESAGTKNESAQLSMRLEQLRVEDEERTRAMSLERAQARERNESSEAAISELRATVASLRENSARKDHEYSRAIHQGTSVQEEKTMSAELIAARAQEEAREARMEMKRVQREIDTADRRAKQAMLEKEQEKKMIKEDYELKMKEMEERMMNRVMEAQKARSRASSRASSKSDGSMTAMKRQLDEMNREYSLKQQQGEELLRRLQVTTAYTMPPAAYNIPAAGIIAEKRNDGDPKSGTTTQSCNLSPDSYESLPNGGGAVPPILQQAGASTTTAQQWPSMRPTVPASWAQGTRRAQGADLVTMGTIAEHSSPHYNVQGLTTTTATGVIATSPPAATSRVGHGDMLTAWGNPGGGHQGGGAERDGGDQNGNQPGGGGPGNPGGGPPMPNPGPPPPPGFGPPGGPPGPPDGSGPYSGYYAMPMMPVPYSRTREVEKVTINDLPKDLASFSTWWQTSLYELSSQTGLPVAEESHRWISCALNGEASEEQLKRSDFGLSSHLCGHNKMDSFDAKLASAILTKASVTTQSQLSSIITRMRMEEVDGRPITGRNMLRAIVNMWTTDSNKQTNFVLQKLSRLNQYEPKCGETDWEKFMDQWWRVLGCTGTPPDDDALGAILESRMRECKIMTSTMMEYDLLPFPMQSYSNLLKRVNFYIRSRSLVQMEKGFMKTEPSRPKREEPTPTNPGGRAATTGRSKGSEDLGVATPAATPTPPLLPGESGGVKKYGVCWGWERYGNCTRPDCTFSHEGPKGTATRPPPKGGGKGKGFGKGDRSVIPKDKGCLHYIAGVCRFGANCRDAHIKPEVFNAYTMAQLAIRRGEGTDEEKAAKVKDNIEKYDQRRVATAEDAGVPNPAVPATVTLEYEDDQDDEYMEWYGGLSSGSVLCALRDDDDGFWEDEVNRDEEADARDDVHDEPYDDEFPDRMSEDCGFDHSHLPMPPIVDPESDYDSLYDEVPPDYDFGEFLPDYDPNISDADLFRRAGPSGAAYGIAEMMEEVPETGNPEETSRVEGEAMVNKEEAQDEDDDFIKFLGGINPWLPGMETGPNRQRLTKEWRARWIATYKSRKGVRSVDGDRVMTQSSSSSSSAVLVAPADVSAGPTEQIREALIDEEDEAVDADEDVDLFEFRDDEGDGGYLDEVTLIQHDRFTTGSHPRLRFDSPQGSRRANEGDDAAVEDVDEDAFAPVTTYEDYDLQTDSERIADNMSDDFPALCGTGFMLGSVFDDLDMDEDGNVFNPKKRKRNKEKKERRRKRRRRNRIPIRCRFIAGMRCRAARNVRRWAKLELISLEKHRRWQRKNRGWIRRILRNIRKEEEES